MTIKKVKKIRENKWTKSKDYHAAHEYANKEEKKRYPKQYKRLNKWIEKNTESHEYIGMNYSNGTIEEEKKVPKKYRDEVALHEREELKKRKKLSKEKSK